MSASTLPAAKRRSFLPYGIAFVVILGSIAAYMWYGRIQAERALEDASLEQLQKITAERPGYARAFYYLGKQLGKRRQYGPAFDALSHAADLEPDDEDIWAAAAAAANAEHGQAAAFRIMDDFLKRHPDSRRMQEERDSLLGSIRRAAEGFAGTNRNAEAIRYYRQLIAQEPNNAQHHHGLARTLLMDGKQAEAFTELDNAVRLDPNLADARLMLAEMYAHASFHPQAVAHLKEVVRVAPNNAKAWHMLGRLTSASDIAASEEAFENAVKNAPDNALALLDLAAIQIDNHKPDRAEASYRQALQLAPKDPAVLTQFGGFLIDRPFDPARRKEAEQLLRRAISLKPDGGDVYYHLGRLAMERRQNQQAVTFLEKAVALPLDEDAAEVWYALSRAYRAAGNPSRSVEALRRSRQIRDDRFARARAEEEAYMNPGDPALRLKVARLYAQNGEYVKAISQYEGCLQLDPSNAAARKELDALTRRLQAAGKLPSMALFRAMVAASAQASPRP